MSTKCPFHQFHRQSHTRTQTRARARARARMHALLSQGPRAELIHKHTHFGPFPFEYAISSLLL